jgi:acyl-coenzyme A thioesterase 13
VASVSEAVTLACAKTVVGDKEVFLGEMSTSYLSAARIDVS